MNGSSIMCKSIALSSGYISTYLIAHFDEYKEISDINTIIIVIKCYLCKSVRILKIEYRDRDDMIDILVD